jgi:raffinose/stachyose/melibiose transport system permease protein
LVFSVLCLIGVSTVYPLLFMAFNSMRTTQSFELNPFGLPTHLSLSSYSSLFSTIPFFQSILHSLFVVVPAVIIATFASSLAAFVFTKVATSSSGRCS